MFVNMTARFHQSAKFPSKDNDSIQVVALTMGGSVHSGFG